MSGINQIQVNADVGLTFAAGLRSILRQDPDVVMVGEIRDKETATLAVQAALTGHLVFSTLHTNSAAGILPRLLDMGIEPFLIASTVHTVIGQRLVRNSVTTPKTMSPQKLKLKLSRRLLERFYRRMRRQKKPYVTTSVIQTCPWVVKTLILYAKAKILRRSQVATREGWASTKCSPLPKRSKNSSWSEQRVQTSSEFAESQGMVTMRQDGYLKALAGKTTSRKSTELRQSIMRKLERKSSMAAPRIEILLEEVIKSNASDLHLQVGLPPMLRVDGSLRPSAGADKLTEETVEALVFSILDEDQKTILLKDKEFDFSFSFGIWVDFV